MQTPGLIENLQPISLTETGDGQEKYMHMSCLGVMVDKEETDSWVELQTATNENEGETEEQGTRRMGRKDRCEADKLMKQNLQRWPFP